MNHPRHTQTIYGQPQALTSFQQALNSQRLHHAWIFYGPKGVGKATAAYHFTRELLKSDQPHYCKLIENNTHPDLHVIESDDETGEKVSEIKVDQIRSLLSFLHLTPVMSGRKVVVIDSIETLNTNSFNALLKSLEEPSTHTIFLLVCHSLGLLPPTIKSRCALLKFRPIGYEDFCKILMLHKQAALDIQALYQLSLGSLHTASFILKHNLYDFLNTIYSQLQQGTMSLDQLLKLKKKLGDSSTWQVFISCISALQLRLIKEQKDPYKIETLLDVYRNTLQLINTQTVFNLDQENAALSILSQTL